MNVRKLNLLLVFLFVVLFLSAQDRYRMVFYNVENLYDTSNDPLTDDDEFTFRSDKHWTDVRYVDKLVKLAQVFNEVDASGLPAFIGLAEVENRRVVSDLITKTVLAGGDYDIVHQDSPDVRGIDVAFLYRKACFKPLYSDFFRLILSRDTVQKTRDILYIAGVVGGIDTLHFFVCHFPSMRGGEAQSEWKRIDAASLLKSKINSIRAKQPQAGIIVMGDLNGKANTEALSNVLGAGNSDKKIVDHHLYNTGYYLLKKKYGSYRYKTDWQTIDHIIVSGTLLNGMKSLRADRRLTVFSAPFLLEEDKKFFGYKPIPTYRGPRYIGGYSDHLPVFLDVYTK